MASITCDGKHTLAEWEDLRIVADESGVTTAEVSSYQLRHSYIRCAFCSAATCIAGVLHERVYGRSDWLSSYAPKTTPLLEDVFR